MQDKEESEVNESSESVVSFGKPEVDDWTNFKDGDILQQQYAVTAESSKVPFIGEKEPLTVLETEYQFGSPILLQKIKFLDENYAAIRRTRGDGNCFFRSFMFSYFEYILESQDRVEIDRMTASVEKCRETLQALGYAEFTFEDFFSVFLEQLNCLLENHESSISREELLCRSRDQSISDYVVMFFRFVASGEIRRRSEFFEPFILGSTVDQFCKSSVEPMGEESDHVHITALSDALGVPIRVVYLDRSSCENGGININHHDFIPASRDSSSVDATAGPSVILLYKPGHYDILYKK